MAVASYFFAILQYFIIEQLHLLNITNWDSAWSISNLNRSIFLFKMPYLVLDLLSGYIITKLVDNHHKEFAFALWILNPVVIYISYIFGQIDIIPTFFVILALYYARKVYPILLILLIILSISMLSYLF